MTLDSNPTLILAKHGSIVADKLVRVVLDGGPSMLERGHIAGDNDRTWLHIFLVFMIIERINTVN